MTTQMQRVAGLVVSLPTTRIALITRRTDGTCIANMTTVTRTGKQAATVADRWERIIQHRNDILHATALTELVVVEDPGPGGRAASAADRHALWWAVVGKLLDLGAPVAPCRLTAGPQSAAEALAGVLTPLWPQMPLSGPLEAPALALAHAGATRLGWDVPAVPDGALDALGTIAWPQGLPDPQPTGR